MAIQLRVLPEERFLETFFPPMQDVTKSAEEIVDIWEYTEAVLSTEFSGRDTQGWDVAHVYRSSSNAWLHVLVATDVPDTYIVIVIEVAKREIFGHYFLNLREKYGLTQ